MWTMTIFTITNKANFYNSHCLFLQVYALVLEEILSSFFYT